MPDLQDDEPLIVRRLRQAIGQNDTDEVDALSEDQCELVQNVVVSSRGLIETRKGCTEVADDVGDAAVDGLAHFNVEGGSKYQLFESDGTIYYRAAGASTWDTLVSSLSGGARAKYIVAGKRIFRSNGSDNVRSWNGSSVTDEGNTNTSVPKFDFGIYQQNKLIVGQYTNSQFWWSGTLTPQVFDRSTNTHKVADQDNGVGRSIVDLSLTNTYAFIYFKNNSHYLVDSSDTDPTKWTKVLIDPTHGTLGSESALLIPSGDLAGAVVYVSKDGAENGSNIYRLRTITKSAFDKVSPGPVLSDYVKNSLSDINEAYDFLVHLAFYNNKLHIAYPSGNATYCNKTLVIDFSVSSIKDGKLAWSVIEGWNPSCFDTFDESNAEHLYFGEASGDSVVYKAYYGTNDNGAAISSKVKGRGEDMDVPEINKVYEFVEVYFRTSDVTNANVYARFDGGEQILLGTVALGSSSPTLPVNLPFDLVSDSRIKAKFPLDSQIARICQIDVEHSELDKSMKYLGYTLVAWPENLSFTD